MFVGLGAIDVDEDLVNDDVIRDGVSGLDGIHYGII